jgi:hypothetical protein
MKPTATSVPGIYKTSEGEDTIKSAYRRLLRDWPVPAEQRTFRTARRHLRGHLRPGRSAAAGAAARLRGK